MSLFFRPIFLKTMMFIHAHHPLLFVLIGMQN